jgi:uncharacterized membrane protein YvbJ
MKLIVDKFKSVDVSKILKILRKNIVYIVFLFIIIFLAIGYFAGREINTKDNTLVKLQEALKNSDVDKLDKIVVVNDKKIDKSSLEPLIKYYSGEDEKIEATIDKLKDNLETADMSLESYNFLLWKRYRINIKTYNLKVNSNFSKGEFAIENLDTITAGGEFGHLIPGVYNISGLLKSEYGNVENSDEELIMENTEITMDFQAVTVLVTSEFTDAQIFVGENDTNCMVRDKTKIGPLPSDGSVAMHLEKDFPWGRVKGQEVIVGDSPNIKLDIKLENDNLKSDIKGVVDTYYSGVFDALNKEDKSLILNSTDQAKDKIYSILQKDYFILKNRYKIDKINIIYDKNEYSYKNGEYRATIVVEVSYNTSKTFLELNKNTNTKSFFTKLIYKEQKWSVEDVENFSL